MILARFGHKCEAWPYVDIMPWFTFGKVVRFTKASSSLFPQIL
jgi:hypothetical protein